MQGFFDCTVAHRARLLYELLRCVTAHLACSELSTALALKSAERRLKSPLERQDANRAELGLQLVGEPTLANCPPVVLISYLRSCSTSFQTWNAT